MRITFPIPEEIKDLLPVLVLFTLDAYQLIEDKAMASKEVCADKGLLYIMQHDIMLTAYNKGWTEVEFWGNAVILKIIRN